MSTKQIEMKDTEARIVEIDREAGIVTLEWGGPEDREVYDFDLDKLGEVMSHGEDNQSGRKGWVSLKGDCKLAVDDLIPLVMCETVTLVNPWSKAVVEKPVAEIIESGLDAFCWPDNVREDLDGMCDTDEEWVVKAVAMMGADLAGEIIIGG
jgi:hypothetical protein